MKTLSTLLLASALLLSVDAASCGDGSPVTPAPTTLTPGTSQPPVTPAPTTLSPAPSTPTTTTPAPSSTPSVVPVTPTPTPSSSAPVSPSPSPTPTQTPTPSPTPSSTTTSPSPPPSGLAAYFTEKQFRETFPAANALYTYQALVDAAAKYPTFASWGDATKDKLELAAFLAQLSHESDFFKATEEYAKDTYPEDQYCNRDTGVECVPGKRYHGRGPIQLSWNYNYNAAGNALGLDLLHKPELVSTVGTVAWQTALWYWMTPQRGGRVIHDVVTGSGGFAASTDIINGALECGPGAVAPGNEKQRIEYFKIMCDKLGVQPVGKVSCNE